MNIAVFSDKFSGTLSATEVLNIVQDKFLDSNIDADFFSVTDGGQESTRIFKSYNFQTHENFDGKQELHKELNTYLNNFFKVNIESGWLNVLGKNSYNKPHQHGGNNITHSGVLYLSSDSVANVIASPAAS